MRKNRLGLAGLILFGISAWGQSMPPAPAAKLPVYEVVSVREHKDAHGNSFNGTASGVRITASLAEVLKEAYGLFYLTDDQIVGLPPWAKSKEFDIEAKVADEDVAAYRKLTREQQGAMLLQALQDRFALKAHRETAEGPVYYLVVSRNGLKLALTNPEVNGPAGSHMSGCKSGCMWSSDGHLEAKGVDMTKIAGFLNRETQRTVIDKTGLTGSYDVTLDWTSTRYGPADAANQLGAPPEIFTAIQEQLGLKLEPGKGPVETIVVDHMEEPTAN
jgi:uncharacterized protein (TIGR03435 family)